MSQIHQTPITAHGADTKGAQGTPTITGTPAKSPGNRSWADYDDDSEVEEPKSPNPLIRAEAKILMLIIGIIVEDKNSG